MRTPYGVSWQIWALCLLVLADVCWRAWTWTHPHAICASLTSISGKPFMLMADHRSNVDAVSMRKGTNFESIWAEWDFDQDGKPDTTSYFFEGRNVFNVNQRSNLPPRFDVYVYGPGKSVTWWLDRGDGSGFTDRIFYNTNGDFARHEILRDATWRLVETHGKQKGISIDGKWIPLQMASDSPTAAEAKP